MKAQFPMILGLVMEHSLFTILDSCKEAANHLCIQRFFPFSFSFRVLLTGDCQQQNSNLIINNEDYNLY